MDVEKPGEKSPGFFYARAPSGRVTMPNVWRP
jgi:hypothetical protein